MVWLRKALNIVILLAQTFFVTALCEGKTNPYHKLLNSLCKREGEVLDFFPLSQYSSLLCIYEMTKEHFPKQLYEISLSFVVYKAASHAHTEPNA